MRSSSMPFPPINKTVEKSASTEFRFKVPIESRPLAGNDRKPTYIISAAPSGSTTRSTTHPTPHSINTNNNPIFYKPDSNKTSNLTLPMSNTNSSNNSHNSQSHNMTSGSGTYLLPDIGAPDVTDELYNSDRRPSTGSTRSVNSQRQQWGSNSELSTTSDASSRTGKTVFYTHSMKKKSSEPKFV